MRSQLREANQLRDFLVNLLNKEFEQNIFTEGYGESRAFADGKAYLATRLLNIIEDISNGPDYDPK